MVAISDLLRTAGPLLRQHSPFQPRTGFTRLGAHDQLLEPDGSRVDPFGFLDTVHLSHGESGGTPVMDSQPLSHSARYNPLGKIYFCLDWLDFSLFDFDFAERPDAAH